MAAVFNFLGVFFMTFVNATVAMTIKNMVNFNGTGDATIALCAALFAIIIWAVAAWYFGIPSSSSHAIIGGLVGAGISAFGPDAVNWSGFGKILAVLLSSPVIGFAVGWLVMILLFWLFRESDSSRVFGQYCLIRTARGRARTTSPIAPKSTIKSFSGASAAGS